MSCFIVIKNDEEEWQHFKVPQPVSQYIKQLEACIRNPEESKLKDKYPFLNVPIRK